MVVLLPLANVVVVVGLNGYGAGGSVAAPCAVVVLVDDVKLESLEPSVTMELLIAATVSAVAATGAVPSEGVG